MLTGMKGLTPVIAAVVLSVLGACDKKTKPAPVPKAETDATPVAAPSKLGDLSTSLAAAREAFNSRKGEARFLTLLSPT